MIAIVCGLVFGIGLVVAVSPWFAPPPAWRSWGPWKRLREDVSRARIPGLTALRLVALSLAIGSLVALVILAVTGAWPVALIVSVGVAFLPYAWVVSRLGAHAKTVRAAWPEVIDAMVSGVRAGTALPQVLCDLAEEGPVPVRFAFDAFSRDYSANGRFELALDAMKETVADPVADRIVEALRIARSVGGADLTRLLQDLASLLREDARVRGELEARQSWTVGAARLGLAAPWVVLLLLSGGGASAHVWNSPGGIAVLCSGAGVCVIAYLIMKDGAPEHRPEKPWGRAMNPWIPRALDLAVALVAGAGLVLILAAALARRPSFVDRVAQGRVQERPPSALAAWVRRVSASALDSLGSTSESVARRLDLAGMNPDVSVFRLRQAVSGVAGLVAACALVAARHASSLRASLIPLCACALVGTLLGVAGMDRFLTVRARARQRAIDAAVPDCSELLALAVAAGESIPAAIERVAGCAGGPLGAELSLTAGHIRNGTPSVRALADLVERTESPALTRLSRTLTTAIERGSPLASVLHDQARDQRERSLAALMEEGGRREIAMLLPVVFLILPVTVMFALYPGLIALDFTP